MPTEVPITITEGNDRLLHCTLTSSLPDFSLVGYDAEFFVKRFKSDLDEDAMIFKSTPGTIQITDPELMKLDVSIDAEDTVDRGGEYFYRLDIVDDQSRSTALYGPFNIRDV